MSVWSLETLLHPYTADEFFSGYFESERLLIQRNRPDYFVELLALDDVDRIITTLEARYADLCVVNADSKIEISDYVNPDDTINIGRAFQLHAAGATIILNHLHRRHPPLAELCASLELEFSAPFQTNIYLTPSQAKGFKAHFDTHDVFVLQLTGSKNWRLYNTPVELPLKGHGDDAAREDPGPPSEEFELRAGDTLYIPRGLVHDAITGCEASLHITVGVLSWTWFDFLLEAVASLASAERAARAALPRGFANNDFDRAAMRRTFDDLVGQLVTRTDVDQVFDCFVENFIDGHRPLLRGQLDALDQVRDLALDTLVGCRPYLAYSIHEDEAAIGVRCHGKDISFPRHAAAGVRYVLETPSFRVTDLPGDLDDAGKLVLVRRLVREGLLRIARMGER